jgi:acyl carrier protein
VASNLLVEVQEVMRGVFNNKNIVLTAQTTATDVEEWTSLNHINLIVALEGKYNVTFDLGEIEELSNVEELLHLIDEKRN